MDWSSKINWTAFWVILSDRNLQRTNHNAEMQATGDTSIRTIRFIFCPFQVESICTVKLYSWRILFILYVKKVMEILEINTDPICNCVDEENTGISADNAGNHLLWRINCGKWWMMYWRVEQLKEDTWGSDAIMIWSPMQDKFLIEQMHHIENGLRNRRIVLMRYRKTKSWNPVNGAL